jgi:hypothetical protein
VVIINKMKLLKVDNETDQSQPLASPMMQSQALGSLEKARLSKDNKFSRVSERTPERRRGWATDFFDRVKAVANHFTKRYRSRNQWCDRALFRNASKYFPSDEERDSP